MNIHEYLAEHTDDLMRELIGWVRLRSVAGMPEHDPDLIRSANWLAGALRETGFPTVEVWKVEGAPAVYAEWCAAPGAPTVLIYSHHDVRAAKDEEWEETPPFEPATRDGYVYGRGTSDAKGQVLSHVWGVRAHLAATGRDAPAVNLKMIVEGEEETGSSRLAELPFSEEDWLARSETRSAAGEAGYTVLEQLWTRPAAEVIALLSGDPIGPSRAAVPAVASASLSIRTVPAQKAATVADQVRRWVAEQLDDSVEYEVTVSEQISQEPYETPGDLPALAALSAAMEDGFGTPPGRMGNAGGGPAELLARMLDAPVVFFGTGLPEDRWHDNDERVSVQMLVKGAATLAHFWQRLAGT